MPRDEYGLLEGKEFRFPSDRRIHLFREMAKMLLTEQIGQYVIDVRPALGMDQAELERLAKVIETQQTQQTH